MAVTCIHFNPADDDYFISGSLDAKVRIWNILDWHVVDWLDLLEMVTDVGYSNDGKVSVVHTCRFYNTAGPEPEASESSNEMQYAIVYVAESDSREELWNRILRDVYLKDAVKECFCTVKLLLYSVLDSEWKVERIYEVIEGSIRTTSIHSDFQLRNLGNLFLDGRNEGRLFSELNWPTGPELYQEYMPRNPEARRQASPCLTAFALGRVAAFKLFQLIDRKSEIDPYYTGGLELDDIRGDIEVRDISFSYPTRPDKTVFNTLIERFYDPQGGEVIIDGINIKEYQLRYLGGNPSGGGYNHHPSRGSGPYPPPQAYGQGTGDLEIQVTTVFVNGLSPSWDEDIIREFGKIEKVELARNMLDAKRDDFGFITFNTHESTISCVDGINDSELVFRNKKVKVRTRLSRPRQRGKSAKYARGGYTVGGDSHGSYRSS
ncbi:heterogeneous nuclear ribonucleoprotein Q-like protein [Tanacetum coccineum]